MRKILVTVILLLLATNAFAQIHVVVQADKILIGPEFVPRFAQLPGSNFIANSGTVTLPNNSTFDAIEATTGTLRIGAGTYRFQNLQVLPGANLEVIIPCGQTTTLIIRDIPINLDPMSGDPFQWGNSILVFGKATIRGCTKSRTWITATQSLPAGISTLPIFNLPTNWNPGDKLLIPDTRQQISAGFGEPNSARREPTIRIASTTIGSITTDTPLTFEHDMIQKTSVNGVEGFLAPRIANLTRNILITSESTSNQGHIAFVGHSTNDSVIAFTEIVNIGRTCNGVLNNTSFDLITIGKCQAGRYGLHFHHAGPRILVEGNSIYANSGKWGITLHQTSDTIVKWNVVADYPGALIVHEDGNEVRNVIEDNFMAYSNGDGVVIPLPANINIGQNRPGTEGACDWSRGVKNYYRRNEHWNCRIGVVQIFGPIAGSYPSAPGVFPFDTPVQFREVPLAYEDNVVGSSLTHQFEQWMMNSYPIVRLKTGNGAGAQFIVGPVSNQVGVNLIDSEFVNQTNQVTACIAVGKAYVGDFRMENGGCYGQVWGDRGQGLGQTSVNIIGTEFFTGIGLNFEPGAIPDGTLLIKDVKFTNPGMWPIVYGPQAPWVPVNPVPNLNGCKHGIENYYFTGLNYCLQKGEGPDPLPPSDCVLSDWTNGPEIITSKTAAEILSSMTRSRTVVIPEQNGGTCNGPLSETLNFVTPIGSTLPGSVQSEVLLPDGTIYRGTIPKIP